MSSWNRRVAAAARARESPGPRSRADRLGELGLPSRLHPDDAVAAATLLRLAAGRDAGFEVTLVGRVFGEDEGSDHLVKLVVVADGDGATALVSDADEGNDFDALTGLPGRGFLLGAIDNALQGALNADHRVGVFAIDVDRFKRVNDAHGYADGDEALRALGAELITVLEPGDVLGRPGGDEYIILRPDVISVSDATAFAERCRAVCAATPVDSLLTDLTLSIGLAIGGPDRNAEDLLREAETALSQAKARGRDRCELYDHREPYGPVGIARSNESERRVSVDQRLRQALEDDTICVRFQPMVELATGTIVGAEALVLVDGDEVTPRELVARAEDEALIRQVDQRILEVAARTILGLDQTGHQPVYLSFNVADQQLNDSRFPLELARTLHASDLPAELVHLEIAAEVLRGTGRTRVVSRLRALGVSITINEIAGPADTMLIDENSVDMVKLDRALVHAVHSDAGRALADEVMADLNSRHVDTCAVGVETLEDQAVVETLGCRYGEGRRFSPPVSGDELIDLVVASNPVPGQLLPGPNSIGGDPGPSSRSSSTAFVSTTAPSA